MKTCVRWSAKVKMPNIVNQVDSDGKRLIPLTEETLSSLFATDLSVSKYRNALTLKECKFWKLAGMLLH